MEHLLELTFTGTSRHKVDGKGRVSIPAQFRRVLEAADPKWQEGLAPRLFVAHGPEDQTFLDCFSVAAMEEITAKIDAQPLGSPRREALEYYFNGMTYGTATDETGRLVLSAALRTQIGVTGEAVLVARGKSFRILSPEAYDAYAAEQRERLAALAKGGNPLALLSEGD